ncbi:hypothetical protein [Caballeronia sp. LZ034LL]|uniref:hypothetical protein n=1 Tax=Caballeronia sp. LZ034LL TaxID=3038567 RepID=UPI00285FE6A6|nr:hypothetical protein [Caballeronia sp. LZ034LL]MDR5837443.1 hypothetical protein [Caballeronia sp. LZ034LL]
MKARKFENARKIAHLAAIPETGLESQADSLTIRCKFNFSYLCCQEKAGRALSDLNRDQLADLFDKLVQFSHQPLAYWQRQKHGISSTLAIYRTFPSRSDFTHPKHVPHDVHWGRFRLSGEVRLAGFVVPQTLAGKVHASTQAAFDANTFYVVFLDYTHGFYKS